MRIKFDAVVDGIQWPLWYAAAVIDLLRLQRGYGEATITGGRESAHDRVRSTLHPRGLALDFRTYDLPGGYLGAGAQDLRQAVAQTLGPAFDVILERDHLHVELSPGGLAQAGYTTAA